MQCLHYRWAIIHIGGTDRDINESKSFVKIKRNVLTEISKGSNKG